MKQPEMKGNDPKYRKEIDSIMEKGGQMTATQIRRHLLGELAGYFRGANDQNEQQARGNAMEKAMLIGIAFGHGGAAEAGQAMGLLGIPPRYAKAIIDTLEGK